MDTTQLLRRMTGLRKIILIIALLIIGYVAIAYVRAFFWNKEAIEYSRESLTAIAKPWNIQKILERASPTLKINSVERMAENLNAYNLILGELSAVGSEIKCELVSGIDTYDNMKHTYAKCLVPAKFEKQEAMFYLELLYDKSDVWHINNFSLNSIVSS